MVVVVVAVSLVLSYRTALRQIEGELEVSAASWARLISAATEVEAEAERPAALSDLLARIPSDADLGLDSGETIEEVLVGTRSGDSIRYLFVHSHAPEELPPPVPLGSERGVPLQRGLDGVEGVIRGQDHHGRMVVAGVRGLEGLDAAVVVQRDLASVQAPFWRAGAGIGAFAALLLGLALLMGRRITRTITRTVLDLETERERSDRRVRLAVQGVGAGFWEVDFGKRSWLTSSQLVEDLGYDKDELEPTIEGWRELLHPDDQAAAEEDARQFQSGVTDRYDSRHRLRAADGSWRWIHSQGVPDPDRPACAYGIHRDVTDSMRALERIRKQEQRLKIILQTLPSSSVAILDGDLRYRYLAGNSGPTPILDPDASEGDMVGRSLGPDSAQAVRDHLRAALHGAEVDFEVEDDDRAFLVRATPMAEEDEARVLALVIDITEQKRRERVVHQQRQQLDQIVSSIPEGIVTVVDRDRRISFIAGEPLERRGVDPGERIGEPLLEWVAPEEREQVARTLTRVFAGESVRYETRIAGEFRGADADVGLSFAMGPLKGPDGSVEEVLILSVDVTEEMEAREALQATRERLEMALEAGQHGIFDFDLHADTVYVSTTYASIFGLDPDELDETLDQWADRLHPDHREEALETVRRHLRGEAGPRYEAEYRARHADGYWIWVRAMARVVDTDDTGRPVRVLGTLTDVTEELEASRQRELLSTAVRQSNNLVLISDRRGIIEYVNPEFTRITGYELDEVTGESVEILNSGQHEPGEFEEMWAALDRGQAYEKEFTNRTKSGEEYLQQTTISPIEAEDGTILAYVAIGRDVTSERLLEQQLRQSQKMEALGQLTGGIAHDFNNVLTGILTNAGLAREDIAEDPGEIEEGLREIEKAAERGAKLVRKLMAFSRDEYLELAPTSLAELIDDAAGLLRRTLPERIILEVEHDGSEPVAEVDPVAVQQTLVNLANNARDAMPEGGSLILRTCTREEMGESWAVLEVEDDGPGMEEAVADRVFEPFFTTRPDGTGLGLAMAYALTDRQRGHMRLVTAPGEGALFRISFPASDVRPEEPVEEPLAPEAPAHGGTILLVEDEETVRRVARRVLERAGYTVVEADDGDAGLEILLEREREFDLVLTDMVMPRMGGAALHEAAAEREMGLPFVFTSGYAEREFSGGQEVVLTKPFLRKPWDAQELLRIVGQVLAEEMGDS